jgi:PAS domain S-box-containing protein
MTQPDTPVEPSSAALVGAPLTDWYRALIEHLPLAVYVNRLGEPGSNVYTSPQLESILGYTAEEWAADEGLFLRVIHPEDRDRVSAQHVHTRRNVRTFGAVALAESAQELEAAAREGRLEQVRGRVEAIEAEYERAKVALEAAGREVT